MVEVEQLFDTISERIEDRANGRIPRYWIKVFFKGLILITPLLIAWQFIGNSYWYGDGWLRFNGYVILAFIISIFASVSPFIAWRRRHFVIQPWNWKTVIIIIVAIGVLLLGIKPLAQYKEAEHFYERLRIEEEQIDAIRIKDPQAIFGEIESTQPAFRDVIEKNFINEPVNFAVKLVNVQKDPLTFEERAKGLTTKDSYQIELVSEDGGTKTIITCVSSLRDNPKLIELKPGDRLNVKGYIKYIDTSKRSLVLAYPKLIVP